MDDDQAQSILQGLTVAGFIVAVLTAGYTSLTEGAVDWRLVWIVVFSVTVPGLIYIYLEQT